MNINKLKLLLSAIVCTVNTYNTYAISNTNVNTVSQEYFQQDTDSVKLQSTKMLATNNNSSSELSELDISDDLNKSFYIPPSVDVLGQPVDNNGTRTIEQQYQQPELPIYQQIKNLETNISPGIKVDWRPGHTYNQTATQIISFMDLLRQKQDK